MSCNDVDSPLKMKICYCDVNPALAKSQSIKTPDLCNEDDNRIPCDMRPGFNGTATLSFQRYCNINHHVHDASTYFKSISRNFCSILKDGVFSNIFKWSVLKAFVYPKQVWKHWKIHVKYVAIQHATISISIEWSRIRLATISIAFQYITSLEINSDKIVILQ